MNYEYESSSSGSMFLEELTKANGEVLEARERIPYQPVVYAIPEEWREEEMELLRHAVQFQPTLYKQIDTLATRQDLQHLLTDQRTVLQAESREMQNSMRRILQQDGGVREKFSSELSGMLSDSLKAMEDTAQRLEQRIMRKVARASILSAVLSVLACGVLLHLVG